MKIRLNIRLFVILLIIAVLGFKIQLSFAAQTLDSLNQKLAYFVSHLVKSDKEIKSCVLSVMMGDSSYYWSGASGIASQNGQVPMTKDTPVYIASVTKLYTAVVIMKLYEDKIISLDDPISKYLPEKLIHGIHVYQGKDYSNEITIQELLSQTSGIADYYSEKSKDGKSIFELFLEQPERSWTVDETIDRARNDLDPNFPPGTDASYSDTNFQLLGKIIESVTSKPLHIVYQDFIFRPLGLKHTWLDGHSGSKLNPSDVPADVYYHDRNITNIRSNGSYWADGGIISTAEEEIIFLKALNEGQIINKSTLNLMHNWHNLDPPFQYGYGTMYFEPASLWGHSGSTGSFLYYSEGLNLYMAGTINQTESNETPFRLMMMVMQTIQSNTHGKSDLTNENDERNK